MKQRFSSYWLAVLVCKITRPEGKLLGLQKLNRKEKDIKKWAGRLSCLHGATIPKTANRTTFAKSTLDNRRLSVLLLNCLPIVQLAHGAVILQAFLTKLVDGNRALE